MIKHFLFLLSLLSFSTGLRAQKDCVFDEDGNCIARGKTVTSTIKTSYGSKTRISLRKGIWQFFNTDGDKIAEGSYSIRSQYAYRDGEWVYYNNANEVILKRTYKMGTLISTVFLNEGLIEFESDTIFAVKDSMDNLNVQEVHGRIKNSYSTVIGHTLNGIPKPQAKTEHSAMVNIFEFSDSLAILKHPSVKNLLDIPSRSVNNKNNLIQNPDFEMRSQWMDNGFKKQIKYHGDIYAEHWGSSNETPDIYKLNDNCFAGFRVLGVNYEVLRNELKSELKAGKHYCLQFKIKLKAEDVFAFNGVSVSFSNELKMFPNRMEGINNGVYVQSHPEIVLACRNQWMTISGSFVAKGGEKYIYISNFTANKDLRIYKLSNFISESYGEIYYYIDDVVLVEQGSSDLCPCNVEGCNIVYHEKKTEVSKDNSSDIFSNPVVGENIILTNIQFRTAKWELLDASFLTLDSLYDLLLKYPDMRIEIRGHTDNQGDASDNETLSINRAEAVKTYLTGRGIKAGRMETKGFGQSMPIDSNETEEGRFKNRRVEFKVLNL